MNVKIEYIYNTLNYGNMMMATTLIHQLNKHLSDVKIYAKFLSENDYNRIKVETKATNLYSDAPSQEADVVIYLGGDDFSEYYSIERLEKDLKHIKELSKNKLVMLVGQTIGPFTEHRIELSRQCLENTKIYTRDDKCMDYLKSINYKNVIKGRDLALIDLPRQKEVTNILNKYKLSDNNYVCVVPSGLINKYTSNRNKFIEEEANIVKNILENNRLKGKKVVLLPHVLRSSDDRDIVKSIITKLNSMKIKTNEIVPIYDELVPSQARVILGGAMFTVTCRMHAAVSSFYMRKPAIALSYGVKYEGVIGRGLGMSNLIIESNDDLLWEKNEISNIVNQKIAYILDDYSNIVNKIDEKVIQANNILQDEIKDIMEEIKNHKINHQSNYKINQLKEHQTVQVKHINIGNRRDCCGCGACYSICPRKCIKMEPDIEGFKYPKINEKECINCGLCEKVCPFKSNEQKENLNDINAYACKNKNEKEQLSSSSGGIFIALCDYAIKNKGVVFGACFDENLNVVHKVGKSIEECEKFKGSKYVQSDINETYIEAEQYLKKGIVVLFSGTQCQIKGLNSFLGKEYKNLITVEIICHGVPSPLILDMYNKALEEKYQADIKSIEFRNKNQGWGNFSTVVKFNNNKDYSTLFRNDLFMKGFLENIYLRPSCYKCKAKNFNSKADISLADFWGIEKIHPTFFDDKGVSLVCINTNKGNKIFNLISNEINYIKTDIYTAKKYNICIYKSVNYNPNRAKFFEELIKGNKDIGNLIKKYTK